MNILQQEAHAPEIVEFLRLELWRLWGLSTLDYTPRVLYRKVDNMYEVIFKKQTQEISIPFVRLYSDGAIEYYNSVHLRIR